MVQWMLPMGNARLRADHLIIDSHRWEGGTVVSEQTSTPGSRVKVDGIRD